MVRSSAVRAAFLVAVTVLAVARPALAIPYETFIDVTDQADLDDLLASGEITEDTYNELLDLLARGINLNEADRGELYALPNLTYEEVDAIIAFRGLQQGRIRDPADLVAAGALSDTKLLAISAFLVVSEADRPRGVHGYVRATTRASLKDRIAPPLMIRSRLSAQRHLQAGIAMTSTRLRIGDPVYDPNRNALIAEPEHVRFAVPKAFVKYEDEHYTGVVGSYRAGFAQRLVFDNSTQYSPNGLYLDDQMFFSVDLQRECRESAGELATSPCAGAAGDVYVTPDFAWRQGLFGVGGGLKKLELPSGWIQTYAWASASRRSIYQYELADTGACPDPRDDANPACTAPTIFVRPDGDLLTPTSRYSFQTVPNVFLERLAGGNVTYFADRRNSVGLTAYGASTIDLVDGIALDFQEWSRYPTGGTYGAAGANFAYGRGWLDVFGEAALSYDKTAAGGPAAGGGGPAAILRMTATRTREELEAVLRYYSVDYANPYARPISQPDEFEGQRARDELGARIRYIRSQKGLSIRALVDLWVPPSSLRDDAVAGTQPKLDTYVRADVQTTQELQLGLWLRYQDRNLKEAGRDQCFEVSTETSDTGEPIPCAGQQLTTIARVRYVPQKKLSLTLQVQHQLLDDRQLSPTAFRDDLALWGIAVWTPEPGMRVRARVRYFDEALEDNTYLERSLSGLVDASFRIRHRDSFRIRMDAKHWLDKRDSTLARAPNPELQLWLSYEARL